MRIRLTIAAGLVALAVSAGAPFVTVDAGAATPTWHSGPCGNTEGVTVVVDASTAGGTTTVRCAVGTPSTGWNALTGAGFAVTSVPQFPGTAVCTIDARPSQGYPYCWTTGFWSYWNAPNSNLGTKWKLSGTGAAVRQPALGSVEGWSFTLGQATAPAAGPVFQRAVDVRLTATQEARLQQLATHFALTPDDVLHLSLRVNAWIVASEASPPTALHLAPAGTAATHHIVWQPDEGRLLDIVEQRYLLNDADASRQSLDVLSFYVAVGGY